MGKGLTAKRAAKLTDPEWIAKRAAKKAAKAVKKAAKKAKRRDDMSGYVALGGTKKPKKVKIGKVAKAATPYNQIGLGNKPLRALRTGEGDNRPTLPSGSTGAGTYLPTGIAVMPATTVSADDGVVTALSPSQMQSLVAQAREKFLNGDGQLPSGDSPAFLQQLAARLSEDRLPLDPMTFRPIVSADLASKLTPTGSNDGAGGDLGSRSGSGRRRTPTTSTTALTDKTRFQP